MYTYIPILNNNVVYSHCVLYPCVNDEHPRFPRFQSFTPISEELIKLESRNRSARFPSGMWAGIFTRF